MSNIEDLLDEANTRIAELEAANKALKRRANNVNIAFARRNNERVVNARRNRMSGPRRQP